MFTGIVQGLCRVRAVTDETAIRRLTIDMTGLTEGIETGASVAVNGTCLTATRYQGDVVTFDVIKETLDLTNLGALKAGDWVNVERSFRVGDEVGGHIVSGHVTCAVTVAGIDEGENERVVTFDVPDQWMRYLHYKGFAALDGASLTLSGVDSDACRISVSLIPETIARTTLGLVGVGDAVNLEIDAQTQTIVATVERVLAEQGATA